MHKIHLNQIVGYNNNTLYLKSGEEVNPLDVSLIAVTEGKKVTERFKEWCQRNSIELRDVQKFVGKSDFSRIHGG